MNLERAREFLLSLPHVVETEQWGGLIFWVGDKAVAGKMFVMVNPEPGAGKLVSYLAGEQRFHELCERDGLAPAPYFARIFWISTDEWGVFRNSEWEDELRAAHAMTLAKMPAKVRATLELPKADLKRAIDAGRKKKAEWEAKEVIRKAEKKKVKIKA